MDNEEREESVHAGRFTGESEQERWQREAERALPFPEAFGQRLRSVREEKKRTTGEVADLARQFGLPWHRTTVGQVESGKRGLTAAELLLLPVIYDRSLFYLLPPGFTWLTPELAGSRKGIMHALVGDREGRPGGSEPDSWQPKGGWRSMSIEEIAEFAVRATDAALEGWPAEARGKPVKTCVAPDETDQKAAARLGTTPKYVSFAAQTIYGRSLAQERDARVNERDDVPTTKRGLQAVRGHVTRALLDELAPVIDRYHQQDNDEEENG